jgi:xylan 1,4-beta-xylosidase
METLPSASIPGAQMSIRNPILPGCHPDPSICRVGDEYFIVTSSFTMHPGLPVHRSRDLETWELLGHVLKGDSWIPLEGVDSSDGVWAPTIRHHDGRFYVVFTLALGRTGSATFVCTAADPAGPWTRSEVTGADGIDPSLFFDDDGSCWFTAARDALEVDATGPAEIWLQEFDTESLSLVGSKHVIWHGALAGAWVEAPHIVKEQGIYHLIAAEGGTERNHAITAARSVQILGPYRTDPRSPLLTHRHLGADMPVQNVGHGDIVTAPDGTPWAVVLGVRPVEGFHTLGRETFLVPMTWEEVGPVFAPGVGMVALDADGPRGHEAEEWVSLRGGVTAEIAADSVTLAPSPVPLSATGVPAFLALRQSAHACVFEARVDGPTVAGGQVGVFAFQNERHHSGIRVQGSDDGAIVHFVTVEDGIERTVFAGVADTAVRMRIVAEPTSYRLEASTAEGAEWVETIPHAALSTEVAGGFVGVLLGVLHTASASAAPVTFRDVGYRLGVDRSRTGATVALR